MKTPNEVPVPEGYNPSALDLNFVVNGGKILQEHYEKKSKGAITGVNAEAHLTSYIADVRKQMGLRTAAEFGQPANYPKSVQKLANAT